MTAALEACGRKQHAFGDVILQVVPKTPHCGLNEETLELHYDIQLEFSCNSLDVHGFLLDNTAFRGYFTALSTVPINISCENLAAKIAEDIRAMLGDRAHTLTYICVELRPFSGVSVSYVWPNQRRLSNISFTEESE